MGYANSNDLKEYQKTYYEKNRDKIIEYNKARYKNNKEKILDYRRKYYEDNKEELYKKQKEYRNKHRENRNKLEKNKRDNNNIYKLSINIRTLIAKTIRDKGLTKSTKTEEILGCTIEEFITYIQSKFQKGMTLGNHGEWHIDHIIPVSNAKTEEELIKLNHYTNLQPLWAKDNLKKRNKIIDTQ